ncbi:hypothetical protein MVEN_01605600 [Mycena venus]|uniref:Alpha-type protein kinase domain-containing protein n=1 Tax=Mycena venus TaxID=2733690 RepID=A0A8H6XSB3_9AGAR|nr:hypothetical protein MVEN_01605600 [Mycena venus]
MIDIVYKYIAVQEKTVGKPAFQVPEMQFVRAGLAICQNDTKDPYLVEEWIDGRFVKYIHNRSGRPRQFDDAKYDLQARFLSFCQHVQFVKTDKAAYVSDFQGGLELLTDPQIISDPELNINAIFGDGNINYGALAKDHECNEFCDFYHVPKEIFGSKEPFKTTIPPAPRSITPTGKDELPPGLDLLPKKSVHNPTAKVSKMQGPSHCTIDLTTVDDDDLYT